MATSFLELVITLALQAVVLAVGSAALGCSVLTTRTAWLLHGQIVGVRRVEQLLDHAVAATGFTPVSMLAVSRAHELVILADHDGDGRIDRRSAERTSFELRTGEDGRIRLVHGIGRQSMTIAAALPDDARFAYFTREGTNTSTAATATLVGVPLPGAELLAVIPSHAR